MPLVPRPLLLPSGRQTMQEWEQGALRPSSYRSVSRRPEVRRTSAAAAGRGSARLGVSGWGARARAEGTGTLHSEARRACGLVLSLRSLGFSDSRRTPGGKHSATPLTTILPLRKLPLWLVLSHFPLSEKKKKRERARERAQFRGGDCRGFLGNGVSGEKILGVVVPTVHFPHAHFRFTSQLLLPRGVGGRTCSSVHSQPPTVGPSGSLSSGVERGRWTWVLFQLYLLIVIG